MAKEEESLEELVEESDEEAQKKEKVEKLKVDKDHEKIKMRKSQGADDDDEKTKELWKAWTQNSSGPIAPSLEQVAIDGGVITRRQTQARETPEEREVRYETSGYEPSEEKKYDESMMVKEDAYESPKRAMEKEPRNDDFQKPQFQDPLQQRAEYQSKKYDETPPQTPDRFVDPVDRKERKYN